MPHLLTTLRRLVGRVTGSRREAAPERQIAAALDGASAIALTEAAIAEAAALGPHALAAEGGAGGSAFEARLAAHRSNLLGHTVSGVDAADARGTIATAVGLSMAGLRATAFAGAGDLGGARDQLALAASRHVPLVLHLGCRAGAGPGVATGGGHDAYHAAVGTGLIQLFAGNVQEAVDLSLVARRVAELALVPVLVAADWDETVRSIQDVALPTAELVGDYLGRPGDAIDAPTPAQAMLLGERRRRVPRWFDLQRPALHGAIFGRESFGLAAAAARPFFYDHVPALLEQAITELTAITGRSCGLLREHNTDGAELLLVVQGAATELAVAAADRLRTERKAIGVVGVRGLRPLAATRLTTLLAEARRVVVLERTDAPLAGEPPLTRELAALTGRRPPALTSAIYGIGGLPLTATDLRAAIATERSPVYLGARIAPVPSGLPKRQVLVGNVHRDYPALAALTPGDAEPLALSADGGFVAEIHRGDRGGDVVQIVADLLENVAGGRLRATGNASWERWSHPVCDRLAYSPRAVPAVDAATRADVALVCEVRASLVRAAADGLADGGVMVIDCADPAALAAALDASSVRLVGQRQLRLLRSEPAAGETPTLRSERLAGAMMRALADATDVDVPWSELIAARSDALTDVTDDERSARADAIAGGFNGAASMELPAVDRPPVRRPGIPVAVRQLRARDAADEDAVDSLPRFWSQLGALYDDPDRLTAELSADPYLASGMVPPLSAALRGPRDVAPRLPQFDPANCTGCGRCWTSCPDGALAAAALDAGALISHGAQLAARGGTDTAALRPMASKLTPAVHQALRSSDAPPTTAGQLVAAFCLPALEAAPLPEARKQPMLPALAAAGQALGDLPLARTGPLFDDPERGRAGDGALLSIAIDPAACKGCGVCIAECDDDALRAGPTDAATRQAALVRWSQWESLPDTPGPVIARARANPALGDLAGLMLSRHCALTMAGADGTEPGSGARLSMRLALAAGELLEQQQLQRQLDDVRATRKAVADALQSSLSRGLPTGDLERLAERLNQLPATADLAELAAGDAPIDVDRTRQLVASARALDELAERLAVGAFGLGRARMGLVLAADALLEGIAAFPYNPFSLPAVVDASGEAVALARGIIEGQLAAAAEALAVVRQARRAVDGSAPAAGEPAVPRWSDLTADERRMCPPLVVVGGSASFTDRALARLLDTDLPIVVVLLSDGDGDGADASWRGRSALGALAFGLSSPGVFVAQSSIGAPDHLGRALLGALAHRGPALMQLHAPSPSGQGFATDELVERARQAVASRAFPLLVFDPAAPGVFGTHLSLDGNPGLDTDQPATGDATEQQLREWRVLCELAGIDTPFTERVHAEATEAVRDAHAAELAALRSEHGAELAEVRASLRAEAALQIRQRLMAMAGYAEQR